MGGINSAILRYLGAPVDKEPNTMQTPNSKPLLEQNLHPLNFFGTVPGSPHVGGADVSINLDFQFDFTAFTFVVNGAPFVPPTAPVLLQILSGVRTAQELLPPGDVYMLPSNKVIELTIPGGGTIVPPVSLNTGIGVSMILCESSDSIRSICMDIISGLSGAPIVPRTITTTL